MKLLSSQRFLAIYSGVLTIVFAIVVFSGMTANRQTFDEIDVHRINVVEPDGTLRMVLSNKRRFPGIIVKGKEYPHDARKTAGILFFDDEGTEDGGLIFGGMRRQDGKIESWGHLSFDQYMQDQVFTLDAGEDNGQRRSGIGIWDRGNYPLIDLIEASMRIQKLPKAQQESEWHKFFGTHSGDAQRAYLGREADRTVALRLKDGKGQDRAILSVSPDGTPELKFLDGNGKVTSKFP
ncbi:MAG TPA: hypothetical protein VFO46_16250 [Candidatus Sulfotelmatobacter sp.]|nr:hypothetical protein [Candidatus Sulfotelmatobacter sp.]